MKTLSLLCVGFLAAGFMAGCKNSDSKVVGKWNGPGGVSLTFKDDKSFAQSGQMAASGKWSLTEKTVSLSIDSIGGKPVNDFIDELSKKALKPPTAAQITEAKTKLSKLDLALSDDAKTLTQLGLNGQSLTFTKDQAK